ncbi:MAG: redoxin domain-containing protein [Planctomycetes bacterium]|nr:redoxin domain-containing protein [Planctomycetota bacterium]
MRLPLRLLVLSAACLIPVGAGRADPGKVRANLGKKIENVRLTGLDGKPLALADLPKREALVAVFLSFECPVSTSYLPALNELARDYASRKVAFLGICATTDEAATLARQAKEFQLAFPLFRDDKLAAAQSFQAGRVPEAFVLDRQRVLRYRGRIDDTYAARLKKKAAASRHDLKAALDEVLAGKPVSVPLTEPVGCPIRYATPRIVSDKVTFHRDVLPILQQRCQQCHRPGEIGPFSLMTYRQAINWASDIKEYTRARRMPPWKPTGGMAFVGERTMPQAEIDALSAWVDGGTPEGDPKDAPPPATFPDGWQLGKPDLVLEPKAETTIGADGIDHFRCFVLPTDLPEDKYVIAYEVRPGNRRVVHHTLHFLDTRGRGRRLEQREQERPKRPDEKDSGPGYPARMWPGFLPNGDVGGWAPGITPHYLSAGAGFYLPRKADIVIQVHYHRTGRVEKDKTRVGLYFAKKPCQPLQGVVVPGHFFYIPPGADNYKVKGDMWIAQDCTLHMVTPHMHLLGKSIKVTMTPPGGTATTLVDIAEWDYNWQETYFFKEPVKVKAGTRFSVEAVYDNSDKNPSNPSSPPKLVLVGEQTTNEMCFGFIGVTTADGRAAGMRFLPNGPVIRRPGVLPSRQ